MINRPILIIMLGYLIGIIIGLYCEISIAFFIISLIIVCILINSNNKIKRYVKVLSINKALVIFLISALISNIIVVVLSSSYKNKYKDIKEINFVATVVSSPKVKEHFVQYKVRIESINNSKNFKNTYVYLNLKESKELNYGDIINGKGNFIEPTVRRNYEGFSYKEYLRSIGIYGTVKVNSVNIIGRGKVSFIKLQANNLSNYIKNVVTHNMTNENNKNLLLGILIGYDDELQVDTREKFQDSNISHILAVSGMHVSFIIMGINFIFRKIKIPKKIAKIGIMFLLMFFIFLTGEMPSIKRACVMAILSLRSKFVL